MKKLSAIKIPAKLDETAAVVAQLLNVTDSYVRKVVNGGYMPKGEAGKKKAEQIKSLYKQYKTGKTAFIQSIENLIKVA